MERKHKAFLEKLAQLTLDGEVESLRERIQLVASFFIQRYPHNAKEFLEQYERCLRKAYAERYAILEYAGTFHEKWLQTLQDSAASSRRWETEEHPDLMGGFTIRIGDTVWDCSLKGQLSAFQKRFTS
ncbi:MAG: F0F1 ATP synthase subunit delta [Opitutales bacterium]|nr:F0F1 ATP synthase subunit delta [Opitutales bacterium]